MHGVTVHSGAIGLQTDITETPSKSSVVHVDTHGSETEMDNGVPPWSPEAMIREVANDPTASIEYDRRIPQAFSQPVEAALQAHHTETRLMCALCTCVGWFVLLFGQSCRRIFVSEPQVKWSFPVGYHIGMSLLALVLICAILSNRAKLQKAHHVTHVLAATVVVLTTIGVAVTTLAYAVTEQSGAISTFATGCLSGITLATGCFVLAHMHMSLWTFLSSATFAVVSCMAADSDIMSIVLTVPAVLVLAGMSLQILLQHRSDFAAQVMISEAVCSYALPGIYTLLLRCR